MIKNTLSRTLLNSLIGYKIEQAREMQAIALSGTSKSEAVRLLKDVDTDLRGILLLDIDPKLLGNSAKPSIQTSTFCTKPAVGAWIRGRLYEIRKFQKQKP